MSKQKTSHRFVRRAVAVAVAIPTLSLPLLARPVADAMAKTATTPDIPSTAVAGRTDFTPNSDHQFDPITVSSSDAYNSNTGLFRPQILNSPSWNAEPVPVAAQPVSAQSMAAKPHKIRQVAARLSGEVASRLSGIASWYGRALHGHTTASGEVFDETALTACHRTLPFGTMVKVENMRNHQTVVVRITDRGVLNPERVIDLSSAAAEKIGMLRDGVAPVRLSIVQE